MRHPFTRHRASLEVIAVCVATTLLLVGVVRCSRPENGEAVSQLEANAHKASLAGIRSRAATDSVVRKVDSVTRTLTNRIASNRKVEARLVARLAANDSLLSAFELNADDSSATYRLMDALRQTTEVARVFRDSTETVITGVAILLSAQAEERTAWLAEREHNAHLSVAQQRLIDALRAANRCSFLRIPCPTRKQAAVGGFVVGALTLAVVAR